MSNIVPKPYNSAQKILKAVFNPAPAIVTATDLNRQIDISSAGLDNLQDVSLINGTGGVITATVVSAQWDSALGMASVASGSTVTFTDIAVTSLIARIKGISFSAGALSFSGLGVTLPLSGKTYIQLFATKTLVTNDTDTSDHYISGAKFEDGSVSPAADHYIYSAEQIALSNSVPSGKELIATIGVIEFKLGYSGSTQKYSVCISSFITDNSHKQAGVSETLLALPVGENSFGTAPGNTDYALELPVPSDAIRKTVWKLSRSLTKLLNFISSVNTALGSLSSTVSTQGTTLGNLASTVSSQGSTISDHTTALAGMATAAAPIGAVIAYAGASAPVNWKICDGSLLQVSGVGSYPELYAAIGEIYGTTDSGHNFRIPDMVGTGNTSNRIPIQVGNGVAMGTVGGEKTHVLTKSEIPKHTHDYGAHYDQQANRMDNGSYYSAPDKNDWRTLTSEDGTATGLGGSPHNNMQPNIGMNYIIKVK